jgi:ribonucleoside-diphosphate reductase alpha chain
MTFPGLTDNALRILERRYLLRDENGRLIEDVEGMFRRVSENVGSGYEQMRRLEFLPNSPTLMNAGTGIQQLSACFVIPVEDSIESIYDAIKYAAIIHQSGGGTGFSFSSLRPEGDIVHSTGGVASGPVSFMRVFDAATEAIKQGGRRRGASMGVLSVHHPDIRRFVRAKREGALNNFNISVAATDTFMEAVEAGESIPLVNPRTGRKVGREDARELLWEMADNAWRCGDPGMIFIDEVNRHNPIPGLGRLEATNPCGEVPLHPFEACNLGSIDLNKFIVNGKIDWERLGETVEVAVTFLDNVIDVTRYPLTQTERVVKGNRKVGLGVMGFADLLIAMGIKYGSRDSVRVAEELMGTIRARAEEVSGRLGEERGDFPNIGLSVHSPPRRNATVLSVAPTGSISMIADCSSGIEPLFAICYTKHVLDGSTLRMVNPAFMRVAKERGFHSDELMIQVAKEHSIQRIDGIPEDVKEIFVTAHDVPFREQLEVQAAFQRHVDNSVSKTVNLPEEATEQDVYEAYILAYTLGCKGITVYREGSRPEQVITVTSDICPSCGGAIRAVDGAFVCPTCGRGREA